MYGVLEGWVARRAWSESRLETLPSSPGSILVITPLLLVRRDEASTCLFCSRIPWLEHGAWRPGLSGAPLHLWTEGSELEPVAYPSGAVIQLVLVGSIDVVMEF